MNTKPKHGSEIAINQSKIPIDLPALPDDPLELEAWIRRNETEAAPLKKGTEAKIIWHGENKKQKTPFSIIYLHGFKGSRGDGNPVHKTLANHFGCNLYLARLSEHGRKKDRPLADLTPRKLLQSTQTACAVGEKIGQKVILMGTSAGGLLASYLASTDRFKPHIAGLILYSPLIHLYGYSSLFVETAWGRRLLQLSLPADHLFTDKIHTTSPTESTIWYHSYALHGVLALGQIIQQLVRPSLFRRIECPVFAGYYFKNNRRHDRVVSTSATQRLATMLGSPNQTVVLQNFPTARTHVISSALLSGAIPELIDSSSEFLRQKMNLNPST